MYVQTGESDVNTRRTLCHTLHWHRNLNPVYISSMCEDSLVQLCSLRYFLWWMWPVTFLSFARNYLSYVFAVDSKGQYIGISHVNSTQTSKNSVVQRIVLMFDRWSGYFIPHALYPSLRTHWRSNLYYTLLFELKTGCVVGNCDTKGVTLSDLWWTSAHAMSTALFSHC